MEDTIPTAVPRPSPGGQQPTIAFFWIQIILASIFTLLNLWSNATRPTIQIDFSRTTGIVSTVLAGGAGERAGLKAGDRILSVAGYPVSPGFLPLYSVSAGDRVAIEFERDGVRRTTTIIPVTNEALRRSGLKLGGVRALSAINSYLSIPLHIWMLFLGIALLVMRPNDRDARLSALTLAAWAAGAFLYNASGMGALFAQLPRPLVAVMFVLDAYFIALFFAACLHFAIVFATERSGGVRPIWQIVPYVVALPMFIEALAHGFHRFSGAITPYPFPPAYDFTGPLILIAALIILAARFRKTSDANSRRRLQVIFLSLMPGTIAFAISVAVDQLALGNLASQIAHLVNTIATIVGALLYAYAVVRHRIFNISVLVRRSIQYALARGTLFVLMSLPIIGLALFLYAHRQDSLAALLTGRPAVYILLIVPLFAVIRYRRSLLESLDRRFFREQYDARQLMLHVVSMVRDGSDMLALTRAALGEIHRALHPKHISLWHLDPTGEALQRGFVRGDRAPAHTPALARAGALPTLLANSDEPLDVFNRHTRALLERLPLSEREWLRETDANLIVPLLIDERLAGLMVLGERMSEEPYGREDRELLRLLAAQLALTLDYSRLKQSPSLVWAPPSQTQSMHFSEALHLCPACGRCYAPGEQTCEVDHVQLVLEAGVPRTIEEKYAVTRLLGRGGMGTVYLANQKRLNRPVAIKVLLSHLVGSTSMRTRFEREARIVARLRHPAIVTIHDFGVLPSGHAYLVMEYLDGQTLRKTISTGAQSVANVLDIIRPVSEAIDAAHRAGVVHRDLKPENIMIVREHDGISFGPRVLDFGLAKMSGPAADDDATLVQSGQSIGIVGTLMYMAPEVLNGQAADSRSDQYSLALITYELLAGAHPLGGATDLASVVKGHTETPMLSIRERVDSVPQSRAAAIDRALSKHASARFESVADFAAALV